MSSVHPSPAPTVASGTGQVDAKALDAQLKTLVAQVNALIEALNVTRDGTSLVSKAVRLRNLTRQAREMLWATVRAMVDIRIQTLGETIGGESVPDVRPEGGQYTRITSGNPIGSPDFFFGNVAHGSEAFGFVTPGDPARQYRLRFRVRHCSERTWAGIGSVDPANTAKPNLNSLISPAAVDYNKRFAEPGEIPAGNVWLDRTEQAHRFAEMAIWSEQDVNATFTVLGLEAGGYFLLEDNSYLRLEDGGEAPPPYLVGCYPYDLVYLRAAVPADKVRSFVFNYTYPPVAGGYVASRFRPQVFDEIVEIIVPGGASVAFGYDALNGDSSFSGRTELPLDDDPRFPYRPRYRNAGAAQFDLLLWQPMTQVVLATALADEFGNPILTEAGAPIFAD